MSSFHCPLCIPKLNADDVYIFLDMDGVLSLRSYDSEIMRKIQITISDKFKSTMDDHYTDLQWKCAYAEHLNQESLDNFRKLIEKIQAAQKKVFIILSSSWRECGTLTEVRHEVFAKHPIIADNIGGKTPSQNFYLIQEDKRANICPEADSGFDFEIIAKKYFDNSLKTRGQQIDFWLKFHGLENSNYIILDDHDDDLLERFGKRFFRSFGIKDDVVNKALEILNIHQSSPILNKSEEKLITKVKPVKNSIQPGKSSVIQPVKKSIPTVRNASSMAFSSLKNSDLGKPLSNKPPKKNSSTSLKQSTNTVHSTALTTT